MPAGETPLKVVTALSLAIMAQAVVRALADVLGYNMATVRLRLTQAKIVPDLRDRDAMRSCSG